MTKKYTFKDFQNKLEERADGHQDPLETASMTVNEAIQTFSDCRDRGYITEIKYINVMKSLFNAKKDDLIETSLLGLPVAIHVDLNPKNVEEFKCKVSDA